MAAIDNSLTAGRGTGKFQGCLDTFGSRIGKERFFEIRRIAQKALGKNSGERRHIHLDEIWKIAVENFFQSIAHDGMVAA
jgi:hypothetical protein